MMLADLGHDLSVFAKLECTFQNEEPLPPRDLCRVSDVKLASVQ